MELLIKQQSKTHLSCTNPQCIKYTTLQNRVNQAVSTSITTRCAELTVLIDRCSSKDLQNVFPNILEHIFGTAGSVSWRLRSILSNKMPNEFQALHHFLGPLGPIFRLIYKLLTETTVKYEYPVVYLPEKVRYNLENSKVPPFYTDLLNIDIQSRKLHSLHLNPFDYYIFHFAYYLVNPFQQYNVSNEWSVWNTVYYVLSCDYLLHFLPTDPNVIILPQLMHYSGKNPTIIPPQNITNRPQNQSKLFRNHVLQQSTSNISTLHQPMQQHPRGEIWRSEAVVQIFIDLWLNSDFIGSGDHSFNLQFDNKISRLPNGEFIRIIRVFIKQLHAFANSGKIDSSPLAELKKIVQPMIQGPMYAFIRHLVHRWPTDGSFRLVLELWLSFIQPWRYSGEKESKNNDEEDLNTPQTKFVDQSCLNFIADNLLAYTVILQQLIPRFSRIDLSSPKLCLMVFRILKVFSQPGLITMIRDIESCIENLNSSPTHSYSPQSVFLPPLCPTSSWSTNTSCSNYNSEIKQQETLPFSASRNNLLTNKWAVIVRHRIFELEGPEFCYKPMFTRKPAREVYLLLNQIKTAEINAKELVEVKQREQNKNYGNLWKSFWKTLTENEEFLYDEFSLEERLRVPMLLTNSRQFLIDIFKIDNDFDEPQPDNYKIYTNTSTNTSLNSSIFSNLDVTPNGSRLRAKNLKYQGDPDLHPIKSNENAFLVRILYQVAQKINQNYCIQLRDTYYRTDFLGKMGRQILQKPLMTQHYDKTIPGFSPRVHQMLPPRISLRFIAKHTFLGYIVLGYLLFRFFGHNFMSYLFLLVVFFSFLIFFRALFDRSDPNVIDNDYFDDPIHDLSY